MNTPKEILLTITGRKVPENFGQPFIGIFEKMFCEHHASEEGFQSAGFVCSLFLSAIKLHFPTEQLHTYVRNIRDNCTPINFDCNSYEKLYTDISSDRLLLIDSKMNYQDVKIDKNDIFEAFDFLTNR